MDRTPEVEPGAEAPKGYDKYRAAGGSMSVGDYEKAWDQPSSVKHIHLAQEAGISGDSEMRHATRIINAFGREVVAAKGTLWLRTEANALQASMQPDEVPVAVTAAVSAVTGETHEKLVKPEVSAGFDAYQQAGGKMSPEDFAKVRRFALNPNFILQAMKAGEAGASLAWKGKMLGVFGKGDPNLENPSWFKNEVAALMATQDVWAADPNDAEDPRNKRGFDAYQHIQGSLSREEYDRVVSIKTPSLRSIRRVMPRVIGFNGMAETNKFSWACRIADALKDDPRLDDVQWLVEETNRFWAIENVL